MPLHIGQILNNRYRIARLVAQGGFGAIYRSWDLNFNRPCAVKENLDISPEAVKQFGHEAHILSKLNHPNLVRIWDFFLIQGQGQYLVMEFIDGDDLDQKILVSGKLPTAQVLPWAEQICDALTYLHGQNPPVIHRDIKPANIKIAPDGRAVLVDFGLAKIYAANLKTIMGARAVTPGYSPPEQYGTGITDHCTDVYAFGATLFTLLTGKVPPESVQRVGSTGNAFDAQLAALPKKYSQVINKAMALVPSQRFQSFSELKKSLLTEQGVTLQVQPIPPSNLPEGFDKPSSSSEGKFFTIPLQKTLDEALRQVFLETRKPLLDAVREAVLKPKLAAGNIVILTSDQGVGTSGIVSWLWTEVYKKQPSQFSIPMDLRGQSDQLQIIEELTRIVKKHDFNGVIRLPRDKTASSGRVTFNLKTGIPLLLNVGIPSIVEVDVNGDFSQKDKEEKSDDKPIEKKYLDTLCELVDALFRKGIDVVFYFDKIENEDFLRFLRPLITTQGVITVMVVEQHKSRGLFAEIRADHIFYVPRIWDIGNRVLDCMVAQNNIDNPLFGWFVDYLNFYSQGAPGKFIELIDKNQYFQNLPIASDTLAKKLWPFKKVEQQALVIKEHEYRRIKSTGRLLRSIRGVLDRHLLAENEQTRDGKKSAVYETLRIFTDDALDKRQVKFGFRRFSDTLAAQFKINNCHGASSEVDKIAYSIIDDLDRSKLVYRTKGGIDLTPLVLN